MIVVEWEGKFPKKIFNFWVSHNPLFMICVCVCIGNSHSQPCPTSARRACDKLNKKVNILIKHEGEYLINWCQEISRHEIIYTNFISENLSPYWCSINEDDSATGRCWREEKAVITVSAVKSNTEKSTWTVKWGVVGKQQCVGCLWELCTLKLKANPQVKFYFETKTSTFALESIERIQVILAHFTQKCQENTWNKNANFFPFPFFFTEVLLTLWYHFWIGKNS